MGVTVYLYLLKNINLPQQQPKWRSFQFTYPLTGRWPWSVAIWVSIDWKLAVNFIETTWLSVLFWKHVLIPTYFTFIRFIVKINYQNFAKFSNPKTKSQRGKNMLLYLMTFFRFWRIVKNILTKLIFILV